MNLKDVKPGHEDKVLAVGKERVNLRSASSKINADIEFLRDRINKMRSFRNPNKETLNTYEEMLKSREAVLAWLEDQKKPAGVQAANGH